MKKFIAILAVLFSVFSMPMLVNAESENCHTEIMFCDNDHSYTVFICDDYDKVMWDSILCGLVE